ncbi:MAG: ABC transporter ATP-binding protein [Acidobacteria bacterium]|nr:ABC transporter ATP-binding protein [Acidobacteriota bacterium]
MVAPSDATAVLTLSDVRFVRDGTAILDGIDWQVEANERWVVLGPNGSGKSTLCQIVTLYQHPSSGSVRVLGGELGRVEVRALRQRIGVTSAALAAMMQPKLTAEQLVVAGKHAALAHWWNTYDDADWDWARTCLARVGCADHRAQRFGTLSSGERQRVLLARALMTDPELLVLDEPTAGLDLAGREQLIQTLTQLARDPSAPALIVVTHHVDEIPPGFTHALLLAGGTIRAAGPIADVLTSHRLSQCFGIPLAVERRHDRWRAWATTAAAPL